MRSRIGKDWSMPVDRLEEMRGEVSQASNQHYSAAMDSACASP
jgi:hypothetical protein